jgi:hypothetical protein
MYPELQFKNFKCEHHMRDLGMDGRILKWLLKGRSPGCEQDIFSVDYLTTFSVPRLYSVKAEY